MKKKQKKIFFKDLNQDDRDFLYICAERYCMGRRTYAVNWCCDLLITHLSEMRDNTLQVFLDDMERFTRLGSSLGDTCDMNDWNRFEEAVLEERARRPKQS